MKTIRKNRQTSIKLKVWKVKAEFEHKSTEITDDHAARTDHTARGLMTVTGKSDLKDW